MSGGAGGGGAFRCGVSPPPAPPRTCVVCGESLDGRRSDARYCSGACRAEASRLARLLSGRVADGYSCLAERLDARGRARRRRTQKVAERREAE